MKLTINNHPEIQSKTIVSLIIYLRKLNKFISNIFIKKIILSVFKKKLLFGFSSVSSSAKNFIFHKKCKHLSFFLTKQDEIIFLKFFKEKKNEVKIHSMDRTGALSCDFCVYLILICFLEGLAGTAAWSASGKSLSFFFFGLSLLFFCFLAWEDFCWASRFLSREARSCSVMKSKIMQPCKTKMPTKVRSPRLAQSVLATP